MLVVLPLLPQPATSNPPADATTSHVISLRVIAIPLVERTSTSSTSGSAAAWRRPCYLGPARRDLRAGSRCRATRLHCASDVALGGRCPGSHTEDSTLSTPRGRGRRVAARGWSRDGSRATLPSRRRRSFANSVSTYTPLDFPRPLMRPSTSTRTASSSGCASLAPGRRCGLFPDMAYRFRPAALRASA